LAELLPGQIIGNPPLVAELIGSRFLWSGKPSFLVCPRVGFLEPRLCSDHFLILLDCDDFHRDSWSFKFENMWLKFEGFVDIVKQ
jgi:hypothetical protein